MSDKYSGKYLKELLENLLSRKLFKSQIYWSNENFINMISGASQLNLAFANSFPTKLNDEINFNIYVELQLK